MQTIDVKGLRDIFGATTGNDKLRFTVVLAARADGFKLKPAVIFKHKTIPAIPMRHPMPSVNPVFHPKHTFFIENLIPTHFISSVRVGRPRKSSYRHGR